ncbi:hypothetical protein [Enterobacter kobei]|uniref:hypothetical protein n=1 Tax=Enterobacter kobei TaxID=208224 RepID=UPI003B878820
MEHPEIIPSDWIDVAGRACVVMRVYPKNSPFVDWNGEKWFFPQRPDFGGYGRDDAPYVRQLKKGRY